MQQARRREERREDREREGAEQRAEARAEAEREHEERDPHRERSAAGPGTERHVGGEPTCPVADRHPADSAGEEVGESVGRGEPAWPHPLAPLRKVGASRVRCGQD